jgi:D-serine deaminase-like pyridoxal phosphate-dependent protein
MGMHPNLGASLSGMGEHAIVNLHVTSTSGKLCWTFEPGSVTNITRASVHAGNSKHVLVELGMHYTRTGCTTASAMTLEHLEAKPGSYWVFVDTKGHPGDLRGKLFAGMAHM